LAALSDLRDKYHEEISFLPIDLLINEVLSIGNRIWGTLEGNALSKLIYTLARAFGDIFSIDQIRKLVVRDAAYSRTGINALGVMYEVFPEHMKALRLGDIFRANSDWRIAYFCDLRDKYPGVSILRLMSGEYDCTLGHYHLHESVRDKGLNAWANRGDCGILDFVYEAAAP
jgi:hypothetical protein